MKKTSREEEEEEKDQKKNDSLECGTFKETSSLHHPPKLLMEWMAFWLVETHYLNKQEAWTVAAYQPVIPRQFAVLHHVFSSHVHTACF